MVYNSAELFNFEVKVIYCDSLDPDSHQKPVTQFVDQDKIIDLGPPPSLKASKCERKIPRSLPFFGLRQIYADPDIRKTISGTSLREAPTGS
jgi:hypothetical protein